MLERGTALGNAVHGATSERGAHRGIGVRAFAAGMLPSSRAPLPDSHERHFPDTNTRSGTGTGDRRSSRSPTLLAVAACRDRVPLNMGLARHVFVRSI
jgi:hypothetical protein